jgi:Flp pilus assembly CpaF family ATPase
MRKVIFLAILLLASCKNQEYKAIDVKTAKIDSIIESSKKNVDSVLIINQKSDSAAKQTIVKVIKEIKYLTNEVEKYKEIETLLKKTVATEKIVYKIDTVYIETKKNFWGKEKTNTTIKSDSIVKESIDTLNNNN